MLNFRNIIYLASKSIIFCFQRGQHIFLIDHHLHDILSTSFYRNPLKVRTLCRTINNRRRIRFLFSFVDVNFNSRLTTSHRQSSHFGLPFNRPGPPHPTRCGGSDGGSQLAHEHLISVNLAPRRYLVLLVYTAVS